MNFGGHTRSYSLQKVEEWCTTIDDTRLRVHKQIGDMDFENALQHEQILELYQEYSRWCESFKNELRSVYFR